MLDIDISHYNEKLKYEPEMNTLRALALWITQNNNQTKIPGMPNPGEYLIDLIKDFSLKFAVDIKKHNIITPDTLDTFNSAIFTELCLLNLTKDDISRAGKQQRFANSGFWGEMRRCIGQFGDMAEAASRDGVTHIVTAAVSGCVIGEYVGLLMPRAVPVDHMIFSRRGTEPVDGHLSPRFSLEGDHLLLVDDIVMESVTARLMLKVIRNKYPHVKISLLTIDIDPLTEQSGFLRQFEHIYRPQEI